MSPRFSFLRYISKANEDDIIPSCASIDEICAAEAPCGIFIKIIDSSISSLFETILAVWSIDEAIFDVQKGTGLPQVTSSILDSSGGLFYGNEYKGKASSSVDTTTLEDGWYLIDGVQFVEIEEGKVKDKSRKYEVAR